MVTITGGDTFFTNIVETATFSVAQWEACIDQAIDKINGYAKDDILPNMSGTPGSKSVSVSSREAGFIREIAVAIYQKDVKSAGAQSSSYSINGLSRSQSASSGSASEIEELAKSAAEHLRELDVSIG